MIAITNGKIVTITRGTIEEGMVLVEGGRIIAIGAEVTIPADAEVFDAVSRGRVIEMYPEDEPYPSCLIYGKTSENRPLHVVSAYSNDHNTAIIITVYQPDPQHWVVLKGEENEVRYLQGFRH